MRSSHALSQPELRHRYGGGAGGDMSSAKPMVKRRVSRVESLRNLFFSRGGGGGQQGQQQQGASSGLEARKRFLLKKRARSAEKEKVSDERHIVRDCQRKTTAVYTIFRHSKDRLLILKRNFQFNVKTRSGPKGPAAEIGEGDFLGSMASLYPFWFIVKR